MPRNSAVAGLSSLGILQSKVRGVVTLEEHLPSPIPHYTDPMAMAPDGVSGIRLHQVLDISSPDPGIVKATHVAEVLSLWFAVGIDEAKDDTGPARVGVSGIERSTLTQRYLGLQC